MQGHKARAAGKKTKVKCPVVLRRNNGTRVKVSAYWVIDSEGNGRCVRYRHRKCALDGRRCPFAGRRQFATDYRWVSIFTEKYPLFPLDERALKLMEESRCCQLS